MIWLMALLPAFITLNVSKSFDVKLVVTILILVDILLFTIFSTDILIG